MNADFKHNLDFTDINVSELILSAANLLTHELHAVGEENIFGEITTQEMVDEQLILCRNRASDLLEKIAKIIQNKVGAK